jgi:hypothetical protein
MFLTEFTDSSNDHFGLDLQVWPEDADAEPYCSYCAGKKSEVRVLMGGGGGVICDRCAKEFHELALELISESKPARTSRRSKKTLGGKSR